MFDVNGHPILANELEVLLELRRQVRLTGADLFHDFIVGPRNIQFTCPVHSDGQERRPSCGISTTRPAGIVHCFTCGYTSTLEDMISMVFKVNDDGEFGRAWLLKNFVTVSVDTRKELALDFSRHEEPEELQFVTEAELDGYRYYHHYMFERGLTVSLIEKFDVGFDRWFKLKDRTVPSLTFPVRDKNGNTLFIARRSVKGKIFHYPEGVDKPLYGVYELDDPEGEIIVCESILNAITCHKYGKQGIALLGLGTQAQYAQILRLKARKIIIGLDSDPAGKNAAQRLKHALQGHKLVTMYDIPQGKDINDLTEEEFKNLVETF